MCAFIFISYLQYSRIDDVWVDASHSLAVLAFRHSLAAAMMASRGN